MPIPKERLQHIIIAADAYRNALEDTLIEIDNLLLDFERGVGIAPLVSALKTIHQRHAVPRHCVEAIAIEATHQRKTTAVNERKAIRQRAIRDARKESLYEVATSRQPITKEALAALQAQLGPLPRDGNKVVTLATIETKRLKREDAQRQP